MRLWAIVCAGLVGMLVCPAARAAEDDAELKARVERIIAELGDVNPAVREQADGKLRNLPLSAYPFVTRMYEKEKENLDAEARARIENSIAMFKALAAIDERQRKYWSWIQTKSLKAYDQNSNRSPR